MQFLRRSLYWIIAGLFLVLIAGTTLAAQPVYDSQQSVTEMGVAGNSFTVTDQVAFGSRFLLEFDADRLGQDYTSFDLAEPSYEQCVNACLRDSQCAACTFVRPGFQGSKARCWLKNSVPAATSDECCISAVKQ